MKNRRFNAISKDVSNPNSLKSTNAILGKKVIAKSGEGIGSVRDILLKEGRLKGYVVGKWFRKVFIDKDFVATESQKSLMLIIDPVTMITGKLVFDADGQKLGRVYDIVRKDTSNTFKSIIVKKHIFSRELNIHKNDIETHKKNVILRKTIKD
jgi:sporulation protein YlmC with PRC-barrel domain